MAQDKGIYHSALVDVTANGPVTVTFTTVPKDSRNKGIAGFCNFVDWNGQERYLNIENQAIRALLARAPIGTPVQIRASGSHEAATLEIIGMAPAAAAAPAPTNGNGRGNGAPAQAPATAPLPAVHDFRQSTIARDVWEAMQAAGDLIDLYEKEFSRPFDAVAQALTATAYIAFKDAGGQRPIRGRKDACPVCGGHGEADHA